MKKLALILIGILVYTGSSAQTDSLNNADTVLTKMTKTELAEMFLQQVIRVTDAISTLPLDSTGGDVPVNSYTSAKFKKVGIKSKTYGETLVEHYRAIIPYADKLNIVTGIKYLQSIP